MSILMPFEGVSSSWKRWERTESKGTSNNSKPDLYQEIDSRDLEKTDFALYWHTSERIRNKNSPVWSMSPEILNPEFKVSKVGTLNPESFESGEVCRIEDFFSNPVILPPANFEFTLEPNWQIE